MNALYPKTKLGKWLHMKKAVSYLKKRQAKVWPKSLKMSLHPVDKEMFMREMAGSIERI